MWDDKKSALGVFWPLFPRPGCTIWGHGQGERKQRISKIMLGIQVWRGENDENEQ